MSSSPGPAPLRRIILLAATACGLGLSAGAWLTAAEVARAERQDQELHASQRAMSAARAARDLVPRALDPVDRAFALLQQRQAAVARGDRREAEQLEQQLVQAARRGQDGLRLLGATDANGSVVWLTQPGALPSWVGNQEFFTAHRYGRAGTAIGRSALQAQGNQASVLVTRPLLGREGGFAGIGLAALETARFAQLLPVGSGADQPMLALYQHDGVLVAQGRGTRTGSAPHRLDPRLLAEGTAERQLLRRDAPGGPVNAVAVAPVPGLDLLVMATFDDTAGQAEAQRLAYVAYGLAGLITLVLAGGVLLLARRRPRPAPGERAVASPAVATVAAPNPPTAPTAGGIEDRLADLLDALPAVAYAARIEQDGSCHVTAISPAIERLAGHGPEIFADSARWQRLVDWSSYPPGQTLPERLLTEPEGTVEYRLRRAGGGWVWLRDTARVVARHPDGADILGCLTDVTRERELAAQADSASRVAARGVMAAGLAHELQQPLQVMLFAAENALEALAEGGGGIPEAQARLRRIAAQAERAKTIAVQLRAFSRLEAAALEPVSLPAAVRGALGVAGQALQEAGVELQVRLMNALPQVRGQPVLVEQVLVNLCMNARDAMLVQPAGQRRLRLAAEPSPDGRTVELSVSDSGGGIPPEVLPRVFDPFFSTKPAAQGTGLGLALCRSIMARFGGSIALRNIPGGAEAVLVFQRYQPGRASPAPEPGGAARQAATAG